MSKDTEPIRTRRQLREQSALAAGTAGKPSAPIKAVPATPVLTQAAPAAPATPTLPPATQAPVAPRGERQSQTRARDRAALRAYKELLDAPGTGPLPSRRALRQAQIDAERAPITAVNPVVSSASEIQPQAAAPATAAPATPAAPAPATPAPAAHAPAAHVGPVRQPAPPASAPSVPASGVSALGAPAARGGRRASGAAIDGTSAPITRSQLRLRLAEEQAAQDAVRTAHPAAESIPVVPVPAALPSVAEEVPADRQPVPADRALGVESQLGAQAPAATATPASELTPVQTPVPPVHTVPVPEETAQTVLTDLAETSAETLAANTDPHTYYPPMPGLVPGGSYYPVSAGPPVAPSTEELKVLAAARAEAERAAILAERAQARERLAQESAKNRKPAADPTATNNLAMVTPLEFMNVPGADRPVLRPPSTTHVPIQPKAAASPKPQRSRAAVSTTAPKAPATTTHPTVPSVSAERFDAALQARAVHRPSAGAAPLTGGRSSTLKQAEALAKRAQPSEPVPQSQPAAVERGDVQRSQMPPMPADYAHGLEPLDAMTAGLGRSHRNMLIQWGSVAAGGAALIVGIIMAISALAR